MAGRETFAKEERLCGKKDIACLLDGGKSGYVRGLRFCYLCGNGKEYNRVLISVPKKNFKRAVKRNLLKRRIRESYRKQKHILRTTGTDIMFVYTSRDVLPFDEIFSGVGMILDKIDGNELA